MEIPPEQLGHLSALLEQLLQPDTQVIRNATEQLRAFFRDKAIVLALGQLIATSPAWQIRQLSAVLLRQRLLRTWTRLSDSIRAHLKQLFLHQALVDEKQLVRQSVADIVGVIAKFEVAAQQWPELLPFLTQACQSQQPIHRELGFYLLSVLAEVMAEQLRPQLDPLLTLLAHALRDPQSVAVRGHAYAALKEIAFQLINENEVEKFRKLIPIMLETLEEFVRSGDDENASRAFEVFDELVECEMPILTKHMQVILKTFMQIAVNREVEESSRIKALTFLSWASEFKPKSILKHKLVQPLASSLFSIIFEDEDEPDGSDTNGIAQIASQTLDTMSLHLPPDQVVPPIFENAQRYIQSTEASHRKACMIAIAVVMEGASDYIKPHLKSVIPLILNGLRDSNRYVRETACLALSHVSEYTQPEAADFHSEIMPVLFDILNDPVPKVREKACAALETYCEYLEDRILPYLPPLMERLIVLLQSNQREIQETVICAIGSAAHAADEKFLPYLHAVVQTLSSAMTLVHENDVELRAIATDTIGTVATAVGFEAFKPYLNQIFELAMNGLAIDEPRIRECTWGFFASIARLCESQFDQFLPIVIPRLIESAVSTKGEEHVHAADNVPEFASELAAEGEEEGSDEEDDEHSNEFIQVLTTFVYEKEMAVAAIGEIFLHTGAPFLPYVEQCATTLKAALKSIHMEVRQGAVVSLGQFMRAFHKVYVGQESWQETRSTIIHPEVKKMIDFIMPEFITLLQEDEESSVCNAVCNVLSDNIPFLGPVVVSDTNVLQQLGNTILLILQKKAQCQLTLDDDNEDDDIDAASLVDDDDEETEAEKKALFIDSTADVIGSIALVMGPSFAPFFQILFPYIAKYYKPTKTISDRSMAVGVLAEIASALKEGVRPFVNDLLNIFLKATTDTEEEVKRNAAYGLGGLCESAGAEIVQFFPQILQRLHALFRPESGPAVLDNACGAVARMILSSPAAVPIQQVLPVLLNWLPVREDYEENTAIIHCLLLVMNSDMAQSFLPQILSIFAQNLSVPMDQLKPATRQQLVAGLRQLFSQKQQEAMAAFNSLSQDHQTIIMSVVQQQ